MIAVYLLTFFAIAWAGVILEDGLPPEPACTITNDEEVRNKLSRHGSITDPADLWPDNKLFYRIRDGEFTPDQIVKINEGIFDLGESLKVNGETCVEFIKQTVEPDYVEVYNGGGCSSYVGRTYGMQQLSLADGCFRHGTIMHEFIHALGVHHEQCRPDRDDFVDIMWEFITPGAYGNFVKYNESRVQCFELTYDYDSVMHYSSKSFSIDNSNDTIIPFDPYAVIGQRTHLTTKDIEGLQLLYGCMSPEDSIYYNKEAHGDCPGNGMQ